MLGILHNNNQLNFAASKTPRNITLYPLHPGEGECADPLSHFWCISSRHLKEWPLLDYAEGQHTGRRSQDVNRTGKEREEWGRGRSVTSKSEIGLKRKCPQWNRGSQKTQNCRDFCRVLNSDWQPDILEMIFYHKAEAFPTCYVVKEVKHGKEMI